MFTIHAFYFEDGTSGDMIYIYNTTFVNIASDSRESGILYGFIYLMNGFTLILIIYRSQCCLIKLLIYCIFIKRIEIAFLIQNMNIINF